MATCKPCGQQPPQSARQRQSKSKITCPPAAATGQCCLPAITDDLPKYQVNPCQPNRARCNNCCDYCVPVVAPIIPPCEPVRRTKKCKYIQPARPKSYAPNRKYVPPVTKMEDDTIYRKSYIPTEGARPEPILPEGNICVGEGKISDDTIYRKSYLPHAAKPPCPIYPCEHKLLGEGPMQDITTQKHDYVPKPYSKSVAIRPTLNIFSSDCPLSDKTVNRLSYLPNEINKVQPIYPSNAIEKAVGMISDQTVYNMSYQPWQQPEEMDMPWARQPKYAPPKLRMEDNTVNKLSYMAPGHYVECDANDPDCVDCPEPPCDPHTNRDSGCCMPCCCPRAAC